MTDNVDIDLYGRNKTTGQLVKVHPIPATNHRERGKPKITGDLKEGIIDAAVKYGFDGKGKDGLVGYLQFFAHHYRKPFASLLEIAGH